MKDQDRYIRSHASGGIVPNHGDYAHPLGIRKAQMVTPDFAAALQLIAENYGIETTVTEEGKPRKMLPTSLVPKGEAEVILFDRSSKNFASNYTVLNALYDEAEDLLNS